MQNLRIAIKTHFELNNEFAIWNQKGIEMENTDDIRDEYETNKHITNSNFLTLMISIKHITPYTTPTDTNDTTTISVKQGEAESVSYNHNLEKVELKYKTKIVKLRLPETESWQEKLDAIIKKVNKKWINDRFTMSINAQENSEIIASNDVGKFSKIMSMTAPPISIIVNEVHVLYLLLGLCLQNLLI